MGVENFMNNMEKLSLSEKWEIDMKLYKQRVAVNVKWTTEMALL